MASSSPRRPAIAGVAQIVQRVEDPREAAEPLALMERAIRNAAEDGRRIFVREQFNEHQGGQQAGHQQTWRIASY